MSAKHEQIYNIPDWPNKPKWTAETINLLQKDQIKPREDVMLKNFITSSRNFPMPFPVTTILCQNLEKHSKVAPTILERNINSAYPVIHEKVLELCCRFILHKRKHGSDIEKNLYRDMSAIGLVNRLLFKRAILFMGRADHYIVKEERGAGIWQTIGTISEKPPLTLSNYISYDEIKISALLSVSSFTYFLNNGSRTNSGILEKNRSIIEDEGIIIGLIGARFEREGVMEHEDIVTVIHQNVEDHSTAVFFKEFYEEEIRSYKEIAEMDSNRYVNLNLKYFDNVIFAKRLALSFDTLLIEANHRAAMKDTTAYIHLVGIGLGVWKISSHQTDVFKETFLKRLESFGRHLHHISDVNLAYLGTNCGPYVNGDIFTIDGHPKKGIKLHLNKREPHLKLIGEHEGKLLVVTFAWDGNALPGNEFWAGSLTGSGDPAAACSTQIAEIHNPHINPKICAENLHIATNDGVFHITKYLEMLKV